MKKKRKETGRALNPQDNAASTEKTSGADASLGVPLALAEEDVPLLPRYGRFGGRCTCGKKECRRPGRHSYGAIDSRRSTADPAVIKRWWKKWPAALPAVVVGGTPAIIAVVSAGEAGKATEQKLREEAKTFKKTVTIRDHDRKIRLYRAPGSYVAQGGELGPGLLALEEGEIIKAPRRLRGGKNVRFANGRAPGEIGVAKAPDWLLEQTRGMGQKWPKDEFRLNVRPPAKPSEVDPRFEAGEVQVEDVLIRPDHDELDDDVVTAIAESPGGPFTPSSSAASLLKGSPKREGTKLSPFVAGSDSRPLAYAE